MSDKQLDISILIVSWNTEDLLCQCIQSIYEFLDSSLSFETIVVDNASQDGTVAAVASKFPQVNLIANEQNVGFALAVNQAAEVSSGRYLLLLNSDARFLDDSLKELMRTIESDETIGIISGGMLATAGRKVDPYFGFPTLVDLFKSYSLDLIYKMGTGVRGRKRKTSLSSDGHKMYEVDWVSGAYLLVRRELMDGHELLDSRIFMYFEDTLLCKKAWDRGYRVVCFENFEIFHKGGASAKKITFVKSIYAYQSSLVYVEEMHGRTMVWWYEKAMRLIWYALLPSLFLVGLFGFRSESREKREIFRNLLSARRAT
ncbi:MAG: glycosyltransferase family 2 protein [Pseudomonadales bacterium]|nr:glycosyltransferase family 2 protein [Pseudomonadales bacterium]